ncbi:polysaccharide lyase, partial [Pontibacter beigongshangensis]|uniref:polysaccharide lyase n=1 Tax=Pontibacter beigongshangensis TaxID=2574733 RepID=UPI00164F5525
PFLIGAIAVSCEQKELEELAPNSSITSESTQRAIAGNLLFEETFENSTVFSGLREQFGTSHAFNVNSSTVFNGSKSGRFELRDSDPMVSNGTRTEVLFPVQDNLNRWYAFSIYLPSSEWQSDSKQDVISQWHQGGGKNPSSSLRIYKDKLRFDVRKDPSTREVMDLGAVIKDEWQTFVVHIKHAHGSDGLVEIWHNGKKVVNYVGGNSYDASFDSPRWKLGLYKSDWNNSLTTDVKKRVLYYDEIRMGNEKATLADMMPRTGSSPIVTDAPSSSTNASFLTNSGGQQFKDSQSRTWSADGGFSGGVSAEKAIAVSGTKD